jgi:hypothetical protein
MVELGELFRDAHECTQVFGFEALCGDHQLFGVVQQRRLGEWELSADGIGIEFFRGGDDCKHFDL